MPDWRTVDGHCPLPFGTATGTFFTDEVQGFLERLSVIDIESGAPMSAFAVAIGGKADMPFCTAYVR